MLDSSLNFWDKLKVGLHYFGMMAFRKFCNHYLTHIHAPHIKCFTFRITYLCTKPSLPSTMKYWALSIHNSWLYCTLMLMVIHILMFGQTQGNCTEEERKALLEIKASYMKSHDSEIDNFLPTWVDYGGSTLEDDGSDCCDWERVTCNTTTGHVIDLSLYKLRGLDTYNGYGSNLWALNVSLFLHFNELTSLSLSDDFIDKKTMQTGLENLKKLEVLDLSFNYDVGNDILQSFKTLTSLKILDLSHTSLNGYFPISELSHLTNLEELDLSYNQLNDTPDIQACNSLSRLKRLENINLSGNRFNNSIISCLTALPSLKILYLSESFLREKFLNLFDLEVLILDDNGFNGTIPVEAFTSFHNLRVLDLSFNNLVGNIPSAIQTLSSLEAVSFAYNKLNGSLSDHGLCDLKKLYELDLSGNMFDGTLPQCFKNLSSLKLLDISSNQFNGVLVSSLIANLTSLEYINFSHNKFEGSFLFSSFSNHTKLELVIFRIGNDKFEVETEEPIGWIPMFQLKVLVLPNCNINKLKGRVVPGFLLHQHKLQSLDMQYNFLEGQFPNWLIQNNTDMKILNLKSNSFIGSIRLYSNANLSVLDISGNQMIGSIPNNIPNFFPNLNYLNLSGNVLSGTIPSSISDLRRLLVLDLSDNELTGEVPLGLFTNISDLSTLKLSKNKLYGDVLSRNLSFTSMKRVHLDSNCFTGKIGTSSSYEKFESLTLLDISNNFFTGMIPDWIGNMSGLSEFVVRNNSFQGRFLCEAARFSFLDISQNSFSGPIPSCLNLKNMENLHLGSNRFTGSMPNSFRNLTNVLTLDVGYNSLSGRVPEFIGQLSSLRILLLRKNNFSGPIPKQLCQLSNASLIDLSDNSLSGSIPSCLKNIIGPRDLAFIRKVKLEYGFPFIKYGSILLRRGLINKYNMQMFATRDEVQFTTKSMSMPFKGDILNNMSGLDLSCNKLTGEIPQELGLMTQIHALNLSHNQVIGAIPVNFSNLANIESLDLSSNGLTGKVPSELVKLNFLGFFNVSHNNLSGRLPDMKAQFSTFTNASYEGNPLLCGPPLVKKCTNEPHVTDPSLEEEDTENWYDVDMTCFYGSSSSTLVVLLLGFIALLYVNPYWRRRWLDFVEECMYKCYYFLYDLVRKSPRRSWIYWPLMVMMIHLLMVGQTQTDCIEDERKALLEIKSSYMKSHDSEIDNFLPTWVDYGNVLKPAVVEPVYINPVLPPGHSPTGWTGRVDPGFKTLDYGNSTPEDDGGNCCDWERVRCNETSGHVIELSLHDLRGLDNFYVEDWSKLWPLNVSLFLHFKELRSLNLDYEDRYNTINCFSINFFHLVLKSYFNPRFEKIDSIQIHGLKSN
ncbi:hypothetical protein LXL04_032050 [Taraxacum kok-saghyz]